MKGRIYKIARSGMAGRKKDTLLLMLVIAMSFFFTALAITLQGSFQKTRDAQRRQLYGVWHAAYLAADDDVLRLLEQEDAISAIGKSYIFNTGTDMGVVGTYNQQLLEMGRFNLIEGSFPQKPGEIALESSKLAMLGLAEPIGEEISVVYQFVLKKASNEEMIAYRERIIKEYEEKLMQEGNPDDLGELFGSGTPWYDGMLSDLVRDYKHRKIDWEYLDNGVVLTLSNLYHINYFRGETPGPEEIREKGLIEESVLRVTVPYKVSGVISDYSERWDVSYYPLANAFITEEAGRELEKIIRNTGLTDNSGFKMDGMLNLFLYSDSLGEDLYQALAEKLLTKEEYEQATGFNDYGELSGAISSNNIKFRKNNFAYPLMEGSTEATLLIVILVIIFIATIVSVFQIFLSQIKRRSRKIALLKSIGATNGQIVSLMAWEGAYLLLSCLPAGALSGAGVAYLILQLIRLLKDSEVIYFLDFQLVGYALVNLQIANGLISSLLSLIIAHIIVILVMFLTPFGQIPDPSFGVFEYIMDVFRRLQLYPWLIHLLICILFTAVTVFVYYLTLIKLIKSSPVENMRA